MKNLTWISDLKLRGSWGMLGNSNISPYQYQSTVNFAQMWYYLNDSKVTGALPTTPANPDVNGKRNILLTWDSICQFWIAVCCLQ